LVISGRREAALFITIPSFITQRLEFQKQERVPGSLGTRLVKAVMHLEFVFDVLTKVWAVGEVLIAVFTTTFRGKGKIQDHGTQIILWIVIIASFKIDEWLHRILPVDMPGSYSWLRPMALGILILGLVVRGVAVFSLGSAFSANVATHEGQKLKRGGLYSIVRHPSYFGLELILLGFALHARTWTCFAVILIPSTLALLYRIHVEETALRRAFGAEYEDYSRSTRRLIPGVY
jgi:protein-S-isoprenylcysteine O-methyltransferase Ste14